MEALNKENSVHKRKATSLKDLPVPVNNEKEVEKEQMLRMRRIQEEQVRRQQMAMQEEQRKHQAKEHDDALVQRVLSSMQEPSNVKLDEVTNTQSEKQVSNSVDVSKNESVEKGSEKLSDKLIKELKEPVIIAGLAFLSNQKMVTDMLVKYIPKMLDSETKQINTIGFLIKGLLVGILFYIIKKYILK
jgi:hypothetical protein